ncbi:MAG: YhcH/YjgK/YiaL family protein [Mucilaginibacter sp.]|uniref:YhcH/YjgK/YiaL family protein n=1 Tax=Mucilaginibacter sp. TaxID=1882438 RepID=UPI0032662914
MKKLLLSALCIGALLSTNLNASAQAKPDAKTQKWFDGHEYLDGLKLVPAPSTNAAEFARQYKLNKAVWDKAFAYLKNTDLDKLPVGKYPIDGENVFASVTDNPTKPYEKTAWESHKKYIDLQYVIQGAEGIAANPVATAKVTEPYNEAKDVAHYEADGKQYTAVPGTFYLFFPADAHRPNIKVDGADHDKKIVLKIRYVE